MIKQLYLPLALFGGLGQADVPTNCGYHESVGIWRFDLGTAGGNELPNTCGYDSLGEVTRSVEFELVEKATAINLETKSVGSYTTIYNQGFEIYIDGQKWFVYYYFDNKGYQCDKTSVGYLHDDNGKNWHCIQGTRISSAEKSPSLNWLDRTETEKIIPTLRNDAFIEDVSFIDGLNSIKNLPWTAAFNPEDKKYTLKQHFFRSGGVVVSEEMNRFNQQGTPNFRSLYDKIEYSKSLPSAIPDGNGGFLPESLDWRNKEGVDFVSAVEDQGGCGSCYAFAATSLYEARVRIMTNNQNKVQLSEQDIITCGMDLTYNQGCSGGWVVLSAGKYAQDYGMVETSCGTYHPADRTCHEVENSCQRWYTEKYEYLGGFYGATIGDDGDEMVRELQHGPVGVGFLVDNAFRTYSSGVFVSPTKEDIASGLAPNSEFNPLVVVNHAVVVVGYGVCGKNDPECNTGQEGLKYWIVKNSWGKSFGEAGYFKIVRGANDLGIESMPSRVVPILPI